MDRTTRAQGIRTAAARHRPYTPRFARPMPDRTAPLLWPEQRTPATLRGITDKDPRPPQYAGVTSSAVSVLGATLDPPDTHGQRLAKDRPRP